ncbi:MAG: TonB-dependent receptor, partial [Balneolaceae bacterium]
LLTTPLSAQITAELDSITVTASRISSDLSESGKSVTVITPDGILSMPVTSIDELFRNLPGVNINARQGFGVQADVGIRGSTFSQVLFMLDNVPLNDPLTAHFNTNIPVSMSEIGQIELIRGAAAASFGADAVGGVIHIKTKSYLQRELVKDLDNGISQLNVDLTGGENKLFMSDASVGVHVDKWQFTGSVRSSRSDGETVSNPGFAQGVSDNPNFNTRFNLLSLSAAVTHQFNERLSWYLRGGSDVRDFNARYFYTGSPFDESVEEINSKWALTSLTYRRKNSRSELNFSYRSVNDIFDFNPALAPANEHTTDQFFTNLSHQKEFSINNRTIKNIRLMGGAQFLYKTIDSSDRGDHQDGTGGIYAISAIDLGNRFHVTSSLRLQFDEGKRTNLLPHMSVAYNRQTLTVRSSAGRAVRTGDYTERYISSLINNLTPLRNIGNPDLKPETSNSIDFGLDWRPVTHIMVSPTIFYRSSSNLIDYTLRNSDTIDNAPNLIPGEEYFYAQNISESRARGFEFISSGRIQIGNQSSFGIQTGYTYILTTSDSETVSRYIANHPSHQINFGLDWQTSWFRIRSQNEYIVRSPEAN